MLLVMVDVMLVLIKTTSPERNIILVETGMMVFFGYLRVLEQNPKWHNI